MKHTDTPTTNDQEEVVETVLPMLMQDEDDAVRAKHLKLHVAKHISMCARAVQSLSAKIQFLDASRAWLLYWNLHALDMMGAIENAFSDTAPLSQGAHVHRYSYGDDAEFMGLSTDDLARAGFSRLEDQSSATCRFCGTDVKAWDREGDLIKYHRCAAPTCSAIAHAPPSRCEVVDFLHLCFEGDASFGGFGGGPGQLAHLAPTYAAVNALMIIGGTGFAPAYDRIPREALRAWLKTLKNPDGSFRMHDGGEVDLRGTYCAMSVATLLDIVDPELTTGASDFITACQTYEGGFSCCPFDEAHGGYTFCATAAMFLLKATDRINFPRLRRWSASRQSALMGGFNGRTNKLIDACYSFWVGALFPLLEAIPALGRLDRGAAVPLQDQSCLGRIHAIDPDSVVVAPGSEDEANARVGSTEHMPLADFNKLGEFVLMACQDANGGLRDKPTVNADYYHTCYATSGLSIAMELTNGPKHAALRNINPIFNLCHDRVTRALQRFGGRKFF